MKWLAPGKALLDYGPMSMIIEAYERERPLQEAVEAGGATAVRQLEELTFNLNAARKPVLELEAGKDYPPVLASMIEAVRATGSPDATPMAAVAGSIAREVLRTLGERGATRAVVNNGGDIALLLGSGKPLRVGVVTDLAGGAVTHYMDIKCDRKVGGIATSGLGGRSFTRGIASAAVALAKNAPLADACATMLANAVNADHPEIVRAPAELLDPSTDIPRQPVTVRVGNLDEETVQSALAAGRRLFFNYLAGGLLLGAVLSVQGRVWMHPAGLAARVG